MTSYSGKVLRLLSEGSKAYSLKDYALASEKYGLACELFSNDYEGKEDADLLLLYGKALFQNGVSKSEVFGGQAPTNTKEEEEEEEEDNDDSKDQFQFYDGAETLEGQENQEVEQEDDEPTPKIEEEQEQEQEQEQEDQEDDKSDFELAWEVLDIARSLFEKQVDENSKDGEKLSVPYLSKDTESNSYVVSLKKLSEVYDLLGEVSLEAENFKQASEDLNKCLEIRLNLYSSDDSLISESHYKLALALEFVEEKDKAKDHINSAIESIKKRNENEKDADKIKDNQELISELEDKIQDLSKESIDDELTNDQLNAIKGILGEEVSGQKQNPANVIVNNLNNIVKKKKKQDTKVNDLTGMVRKRKLSSDGNNNNNKKQQK
ncbi:unnamed protein product [Candida verbasci]|uniref:Tetratricopeptide SHNi-TPR domain-containing protein n=1 Tax=Candida verbasci TaxID=1227364 RepID=A0A9W4X9Z9_9ASCO|nr:unnamed protein product [Candida verbasci]